MGCRRSTQIRRVLIGTTATAVTVAALIAAAPAAQAQTPVPGSHARWAIPATRLGAAPASQTRTVRIYLRGRDSAQAAALAAAVSDPHSPQHGHYLTPAQVRSRFAPTAQTVSSVRTWLRDARLQLGEVPANNAFVPATGSIARLQKAFGVSLNRYRVRGGTRIAADRPANVPAALAASVLSVSGLTETRAVPSAVPPETGFRNARPCSDYYGQKVDTTDPAYNGVQRPYAPCGYKPAQIRSAYALDGVLAHGIDGTGVRVAVVDAFASPTGYADASNYATRNDPGHSLTAAQYSEFVFPPTAGLEPPDQCNAAGWYGEQTLDIEGVHATAPGAAIQYVGARDCQGASLDEALNHVVAEHSADVVTNSYGDTGEDVPADEVAAFNQTVMQAAMEGITVLFSSGDAGDEVSSLGYASPDFNASSPWVTAVGGTSLAIGADGTRQFETGWETGKSTLSGGSYSPGFPGAYQAGSGGGTSRLFAEPDYQVGVVPDELAAHNRSGDTRGRVVPDIASLGDPNTGMLIGQTQTFPDGVYYDQYRNAGTSLASPLTAGVVALADQLAGRSHGFLNPALYSVTRTAGGLTDVTHVDGAMQRVDYANSTDATDGLIVSARSLDYQALAIHTAPGYDDVTGLGTINAPVALAIDSLALSPASTTAAAGAPTSFAATASDGLGASFDVSASTTLTISPSGAGTGAQCTGSSCSATRPGVYTVTGTYAGTLPTINGQAVVGTATLTVTAGDPATVTARSGTPQTATAGSTFAQPLTAAVTDSYGNAVAGTAVTFTIPPASATTGGASFPGGASTAVVPTGTDGVATSPTITAGPQAGPVTVSATVGSLSPAVYTLSVVAAGPPRADLAVAVSAPSTARTGQSVTLRVSVTDKGPQSAEKVGTALQVPRGWRITNTGGGVRRGQVVLFGLSSLGVGRTVTYTVTAVASRGDGVTLAGAMSGTRDPDLRNNVGGVRTAVS